MVVESSSEAFYDRYHFLMLKRFLKGGGLLNENRRNFNLVCVAIFFVVDMGLFVHRVVLLFFVQDQFLCEAWSSTSVEPQKKKKRSGVHLYRSMPLQPVGKGSALSGAVEIGSSHSTVISCENISHLRTDHRFPVHDLELPGKMGFLIGYDLPVAHVAGRVGAVLTCML